MMMAAFHHISFRPRSISPCRSKRKQHSTSPIMLVLLVLLSTIHQCTWAIGENNEHHRHRHDPIPKYRTYRSSSSSNPAEKSEHERPTLYKCDDSDYPSDLSDIMTKLDDRLRAQEEAENARVLTTLFSEAQWNDTMKQTMEKLNKTNALQLEASSSSSESNRKDESAVDMMRMANDNNSWRPHNKLLLKKQNEYSSEVVFGMEDKLLHCPPGRLIKEFHWHSVWDDKWRIQDFTDLATFELSSMSLILADTNDTKLVWNKKNGERHIFKRNDYCVWKQTGKWVTFKVCLPPSCDQSPCIRKCCLPSELIDEETRGCKPTYPEWRPKLYKTTGGSETIMDDSASANASVIVGYPDCQKKYILNSGPGNNFKLLLNGTLVQVEEDARTYIEPGYFCIDGLYYMKGKEPNSRVNPGSEWDQVVIACEPTNKNKIQSIRIVVYATLNFVSAVFLLITDIVYILIWKHQNNIHSWLQFCYATSLLFTFTCFFINQVYSTELLQISPNLCKIMGWLAHLTYLSAFFWLTSMNFDLYWRFSRPLRSTRIQTQEEKRKRFMGFAAFSIITPLVISSIGIALDYKYGDMLLPPITVPGFGKERCYFRNKRAQIPYLYFPAGVLLLVDFIFFASTVLHLRKMHTNTEMARTQSTSTMEDKRGLRVIAKLFIVMGVLWIFELLSWICQLVFPEAETILTFIFAPIDCLNSAQGIFIFCIFICKPNVTKHLCALFRIRRDDPGQTWKKQTPLPSISTVQQTVIQYDASWKSNERRMCVIN